MQENYGEARTVRKQNNFVSGGNLCGVGCMD